MFRVRLRPWLPPFCIAAVVVLGYALWPTRLPLMGEEPTRARHGVEMAETGEWVVATIQGQPILDRPPLQYWMFAGIHQWIHPLGPMTLRLSTAAVILANALLIWWYARRFLSEHGALLAAVAYPTTGHVFDLGRRAETDGLFALLLSAALLAWHYGYASGWGPVRTWLTGSLLATLATLAKGTQAPVAYFGAIVLFLSLRRDWRFLFHWANFAGGALFLSLIAAWQVPLFLAAGWEGTRTTWIDPGGGRVSFDLVTLLLHLVRFPLEVLVAGLPWSVLVFGVAFRVFWKLDARARSALAFVSLGAVAIFAPVWLTAGGQARYVMPLYPLMAIVAGAAGQQLAAATAGSGAKRFWTGYLRTFASILALAVAIFAWATWPGRGSDHEDVRLLVQPQGLMLALVPAMAIASWILFRSRSTAFVQTVTLALALAAVFNGPWHNTLAADTPDPSPEIRALKARVGPDASLVSFGRLHRKFVYWWGDPIAVQEWPRSAADVPDDLELFAVYTYGGEPRTERLPFDWEPLARINMDAEKKTAPLIVVGRRLRTAADSAPTGRGRENRTGGTRTEPGPGQSIDES